MCSLTWEFTSRPWDDGDLSPTLRDFLLHRTGSLTFRPPSPHSQLFRTSQGSKLWKQQARKQVSPIEPGASQMGEAIKENRKCSLQSWRQTELCCSAQSAKVIIKWLETIVHERHLHKRETLLTALFKFISKQTVVSEELDCFPTLALTTHRHDVNLPALILGAPEWQWYLLPALPSSVSWAPRDPTSKYTKAAKDPHLGN